MATFVLDLSVGFNKPSMLPPRQRLGSVRPSGRAGTVGRTDYVDVGGGGKDSASATL